MLGRVYKALDTPEQAVAVLQRGIAAQAAHVATLKEPTAAATNAAVLCCALADVLPLTEAHAAWERALTFDSSHVPALLQLARDALRSGNLVACEARCTQLLGIDPDSREGHLLMVDVLVVQERAAEALQHLQPLLMRNVDCVLTARYIDMLQRAGGVAELELPCALGDVGGLEYCKGLLAIGTGDREAAVSAFSAAMADDAWRARAASALLQLLLEGPLLLLWEGSPAWEKGAPPEDLEYAKEVAGTLGKDDPLAGAAWQALATLCAAGASAAEHVLGGVLVLLFDHQQHPGLLVATAAAHLAGGQGQQVWCHTGCQRLATTSRRRSRSCRPCGCCLPSQKQPGNIKLVVLRWHTCTCASGGRTRLR